MALTEGKHPGEFLVSEANGFLSRETGTLISGQDLDGGTVLGLITASGKFTALAPSASDGSETAAAILYADTDASGGDVTNAVVIVRNAEVNSAEIGWGSLTDNQIATAKAELANKNIIVRPAI